MEDIIKDGINDIFIECQSLLGIKHGDVSPEDYFEIKRIEKSLKTIILKQK